MFSSVFSVCCRISVPTNSPVFGSRATCPDIYKNPFARMPCEYGPMGFGPRSVSTTSLMVCSPSHFPHSLRPFLYTAHEILRYSRAFHPHSHKFRDVLVGFLFECGD